MFEYSSLYSLLDNYYEKRTSKYKQEIEEAWKKHNKINLLKEQKYLKQEKEEEKREEESNNDYNKIISRYKNKQSNQNMEVPEESPANIIGKSFIKTNELLILSKYPLSNKTDGSKALEEQTSALPPPFKPHLKSSSPPSSPSPPACPPSFYLISSPSHTTLLIPSPLPTLIPSSLFLSLFSCSSLHIKFTSTLHSSSSLTHIPLPDNYTLPLLELYKLKVTFESAGQDEVNMVMQILNGVKKERVREMKIIGGWVQDVMEVCEGVKMLKVKTEHEITKKQIR